MKYIVDTNVVSETMKREPNPNVMNWLSNHEAELFLTSITVEEMRFGQLMMPAGKRREKLRESIDSLITEYASKILAFDTAAAQKCAELHELAISAGKTPTIEDLMIAGICLNQQGVLITRNVKDFDYLDIEYVNPFDK